MYRSLYLEFEEVPEGTKSKVAAHLNDVTPSDQAVVLQAVCRALELDCQKAASLLALIDIMYTCERVDSAASEEVE